MKYPRTTFLLTWCALALVTLAYPEQLAANVTPPNQALNVVFFLVDDFGACDIGATGSKFYETPRMDQLAADSVRFTQAYAAFPRCVPSRFALMTGWHPSRAEGRGEELFNMDPAHVTMAEAIKKEGFATFFAGKWHIGRDATRYPEAQGFDVNVGGGSAGETGSYFAPYDHKRGLTGPEKIRGAPGEYLTDRLTTEAIDFIRSHRDQRFFVYLSHYAVHTPIQGKPEKVARYKEKAAVFPYEGPAYASGPDGRELRHQNNAGYAAMIESVDESLGRVIDELKALGLYENTLIVFTSDNGGLSNAGPTNKRELATSNLPLRAGKGHFYEGGIRVPAFVRWPGVTKPGTTADFPITGMDYYPSILEILGLPLHPQDHLDGVSFARGLQRDAGFNLDRDFFWYSDRGRQESTGDLNCAVLRRGRFKLMEFFNEQRVELYDLVDDPGEHHDLSSAQPDRRDVMLAKLHAWKKEMNVQDRPQEKLKPGERYDW